MNVRIGELCLEWHHIFSKAFEPVIFEPYAVTNFGIPLWHMLYFKGRRSA